MLTYFRAKWRLLMFANFQIARLAKKYLKDSKHNSIHLAGKNARIFVLGHFLLLEAHNFPRAGATLSETCSLLGP